MDLTGRSAIVMGADRETPAAVALALAEAGAGVALTTTTGEAEESLAIRRLARKVEAMGRRSLAEAVDLSNGANVQVAVRQIAKQLPVIDLLVISPGLTVLRPAERLSDAEWARALGFNLSSVFYGCRAVAREMLAKSDAQGGRIVVLLPSTPDVEGTAALVAARAGLEALVPALAREWRDRGVLVNAVALPPDSDDEASNARVASLVLELADSERVETGQVLAVDG
jgi:3-oxoacyl-[acyl-carrier protein] reductase